jgi:fibrillarin-like rRNA methylase
MNARFIKALMSIKITREARQLLEKRSARASRFLDAIAIADDNLEPHSKHHVIVMMLAIPNNP